MRVFIVAVGLFALSAAGFAAQVPQKPPSILIESLIGQDSFSLYCSSCRGSTGRGDGPVAVALRNRAADLTTLARCNDGAYPGEAGWKRPDGGQLRRTPPDLTKYTARNGGIFPRERVYRIVDGRDVPSHGDRDMPVWGDVFKQTEGGPASDVKTRIEAIVRYLEGIQERAAD